MSRAPRAAARKAAPRLIVDKFPAPPRSAVEAELAEALESGGLAALAKAIETHASAVRDGAEALGHFTAAIKPAADGIDSLADAQRKLCQFIVKHRLKLAASIPAVLMAIGAISPNAAQALGEWLRTWGLM